MFLRPLTFPLFPYTTLFRSQGLCLASPPRRVAIVRFPADDPNHLGLAVLPDRQRKAAPPRRRDGVLRSEEHTSELQSRQYLVCRLLLGEKQSLKAHRHIDRA